MNPTYRWSINGHTVSPLYGEGLSKDYDMESGQKFFRAKLSGNLVFVGVDFDWLDAQAFDTEFFVTMERYVSGAWVSDFVGRFMKTDASWDSDNRRVQTALETIDGYEAVMAGLDKEFNLVKCNPEIVPLKIDKRPAIQMYVPGDSVIGCFLGGTYWEQETTEVITDTNDLVNTYKFYNSSDLFEYVVTGEVEWATQLGTYAGKYPAFGLGKLYNANGLWYIQRTVLDPEAGLWKYELCDVSDDTIYFRGTSTNYASIDLYLIGFSNKITMTMAKHKDIYTRWLLDVDTFNGASTFAIPESDIVANNRNYQKVAPYREDSIVLSSAVSDTPTEFGTNSEGLYYVDPSTEFDKYYPAARSTWGDSSIWFQFSTLSLSLELSGRKEYVLRDCNPLSSAINALLQQIDPTITHLPDTDHSEFLYSATNPLTNGIFTLLITQKSNVLTGGYDQPAQKAPVTLGAILGMLRDTFRCYWFIDDGKLRIEHINWFRRGGSYTATPVLETDLTTMLQPRNAKPWGYQTSAYTFAKEDLPERFQCEWMDSVSSAFEGYPIEVLSKYVTPGKIETVSVGSFTSDIDFMMLVPEGISKDGFALFAAVLTGGSYKLPYETRTLEGAALVLQNGYLSFMSLHENYYKYDLPAKSCKINGQTMTAAGIIRSKKQEVSYPSASDPDPFKLVRTYLGYGAIEKVSIDLESRINKVTLAYDAEALLPLVTITLFRINAGQSSTSSRIVELNFTTTGTPAEYSASERADFVSATWEAIAPTMHFTLSDENEVKTVYLKVRRYNDLSESAVASDSITLNMPAPSVVIASATPYGDGDHFTVSLTGTEHTETIKTIVQTAGEVEPIQDDWDAALEVAYAEEVVLSAGVPGTYDLYVRGFNSVGNDTALLEDVVIPETATVWVVEPNFVPVLGGDVTVTFSRDVKLSIILSEWITLAVDSEVTTEDFGRVLKLVFADNTQEGAIEREGIIELDDDLAMQIAVYIWQHDS